MWRTNNEDKTKSDNVLKEALLRQLSHTVKEVQLFYSQTGETCTTQEGPSALVTVLEAVFLHALKRSLLESAIRTVSVADDVKPAPTFFEAVASVTHKETRLRISKLNRINTNVGRSRAWIRLSVNEGAVSSYLYALQSSRILSKFYRPCAFLRDREALDTATRLLDGLLTVHFDLPINSSLLNTWSSEPLLMSGLWAPALRPSVQMAVDVASGIEVEDACSIPTPSSSVRSLMILDEAQALRIILGTSLPEEDYLPEDLTEQVDQKMEELEVERREVLQRSYSYIVESCSPKPEHAFPEPAQTEPDPEPVTTTLQPENPPEEKTYSDLLPTDASNDEDRLTSLLEVLENKDTEPRHTRPTIEDIVLKIPRELGLKSQRFECANCWMSISLNFGPAVLCHVTGEQLCESCHKSETSVVPSRIIFNWDHNKYPIGKRAAEYLSAIQTKPIFDIETMNPKLYSAVSEMREILRLRRQLNLLHLYLSTCKEKTELPTEAYIYESVHCYSLADLIAVPTAAFKTELLKLIQFGKTHVIGCWVCKEKGFICEVCKDPDVIYPFDDGTIYRCSKCKAVYHEKCLMDQGRRCPKCIRINARVKTTDEK